VDAADTIIHFWKNLPASSIDDDFLVLPDDCYFLGAIVHLCNMGSGFNA
jgi:hypothetical protein